MRTILLFIFLFFFPVCAFALDLSGRVVDAAWLSKNLTDAGLRIVDVRTRVDDYWRAHIPGAVYFDPAALTIPDTGVPVKLAPPPIVADMLGEMGIAEGTAVVICGDGKDYHRAAYLLWVLDYLGHRNVALLDGGFARWTKLRLPATQEYPKIAPVRYPIDPEGGYRREVFATTGDVQESMGKEDAILLDTRSADMFCGLAGAWARKGHIPGAVNRFFADDMGGAGLWKNRDVLAKDYARLGVTPERTVIVYGSYGRASALTYFTLKYLLGFPRVRLYDGGFSEWSGNISLPVEKGGR